MTARKRYAAGKGDWACPNYCVQGCRATQTYFTELGLSVHFLPLNYNETTRNGIAKKLRRNVSFVKTDVNTDPVRAPESFDLFSGWNDVRKTANQASKLAVPKSDTRGFLLILAEDRPNPQAPSRKVNETSQTPESDSCQSAAHPRLKIIAGCTVMIVDPGDPKERRLSSLFCSRDLPSEVAQELIRVLFIRALLEGLFFDELTEYYRRDPESEGAFTKFRGGFTEEQLKDPDFRAEDSDVLRKARMGGRFFSLESREMSFFPNQIHDLLKNDLKCEEHWDFDGEGIEDLDDSLEGKDDDSVAAAAADRKGDRKGLSHTANRCYCTKQSFKPGFYQFFFIRAVTLKHNSGIGELQEPSSMAQQYFASTRNGSNRRLAKASCDSFDPKEVKRKRVAQGEDSHSENIECVEVNAAADVNQTNHKEDDNNIAAGRVNSEDAEVSIV